jgi:hypothetical protein
MTNVDLIQCIALLAVIFTVAVIAAAVDRRFK